MATISCVSARPATPQDTEAAAQTFSPLICNNLEVESTDQYIVLFLT